LIGGEKRGIGHESSSSLLKHRTTHLRIRNEYWEKETSNSKNLGEEQLERLLLKKVESEGKN